MSLRAPERHYGEIVLSKGLHIVDLRAMIVMCTGADVLISPASVLYVGQSGDLVPYCTVCMRSLLNEVVT